MKQERTSLLSLAKEEKNERGFFEVCYQAHTLSKCVFNFMF